MPSTRTAMTSEGTAGTGLMFTIARLSRWLDLKAQAIRA
jgi:hypothetical protein